MGVEPDVRAGVPNVPGGTVTDISRLSPNFQPLLGSYLATRIPSLINVGGLAFNDNMPLRKQPPVVNTVPGAIAIQAFEDTGNWLGQAGDSVSWAPFIRKSPLAGQAAKAAIVRFAGATRRCPTRPPRR